MFNITYYRVNGASVLSTPCSLSKIAFSVMHLNDLSRHLSRSICRLFFLFFSVRSLSRLFSSSRPQVSAAPRVCVDLVVSSWRACVDPATPCAARLCLLPSPLRCIASSPHLVVALRCILLPASPLVLHLLPSIAAADMSSQEDPVRSNRADRG